MSTWKLRERLGQRVLRGIRHHADVPAVEVLQDEALEDVVDLRGLEAQFAPGVAADRALVLEIADAAGKEDDLAHRHVGVAPAGGAGRRFARGG